MGVDAVDWIARYDQQHHRIHSKAAQEQDAAFQESIRMEFRAAAAAPPIYGVELPAALLIGWFCHPISTELGGYLQPRLFDATLGMPAATKVLLLDGILILAIGTQWLLVGIWLNARRRTSQNDEFPQKVAMAITVAGIVSASLCHVRWLDLFSVLAAFGSAVLWLILLANMRFAAAQSAWIFCQQPWVRPGANG